MRALLVLACLLVPGVVHAQASPDTLWLRSGKRIVGPLEIESSRQGVPVRIGTPGGETFAVDYVVGFTEGERHARVVPVLRRGRAGYVVVERVTAGRLALFAPWGGAVREATYFTSPDGTIRPLTPEHLAPFVGGEAQRRVARARAGQTGGRTLVFVGGLALAAGTALTVYESDVQGRTTVTPLSGALMVGGAWTVGGGLVWRRGVGPQLRLAAQGL